MGKTRIGVVLRESVGGAKSNNQSADLVALTDRYHVFVKKLHILIHSLQQHHAVMMQIDKTRTQVCIHDATVFASPFHVARKLR
jgi:hypothetical protein